MFKSSEAAEEAFYAAFSMSRLDDMMRVWAADGEPVCIHPGGPRLSTIAEIRESWGLIFTDSLPRSFNLRGRIISGESNQRVHLLEENISVPGTSFVAPPVLATNIYRLSAAGWQMVLHHASVAPQSLHLEGASTPSRPHLH
ncbi:MAG: nuclear transport factor 2 family protein [Gammaproteobacteria bacterium]|nr:nuclear transport factor 2 family protein [Gammaproteobacteria bacterium]